MKKLNILFITQEDPFYVRLFFEEFFRNYPHPEDIKGVVIAPTMGKKSAGKLMRQMYDFYGPVDFFRVGSKYAYYRFCDVISRNLPLRSYYSIAQVCRKYAVPVMQRANVNSEDFLAELRKMNIDLVISVAAPQIFKEKLIKLPGCGCINIHNSKLPKYRGMLPNFWQMFNGEKTVGTTIHFINAGIDDGDILLQKETPIESGESLDSLIKRTKKLGAIFMIDAVLSLKQGPVKPLPNRKAEATYFTFPTKEQAKEFRRRGYRLL
jgi:methionyl-tRNA formyltransferase